MSGTYGVRTRSKNKETQFPSPRERKTANISRESNPDYSTDDEDERSVSVSPKSRGQSVSDNSRLSPDSSPSLKRNIRVKSSPEGSPGHKTTRHRGNLYPDLTEEIKKAKRLEHIEEKPKRNIPKQQKAIQQSGKSNGTSCSFILIAICVILYAIYHFRLHEKLFDQSIDLESDSEVPETNLYDGFRSNLKELQTTFVQQDRKSWRVIHAPIRRILLEDEPSYPAVLLFVVPKEHSSEKTATCLAQKVLAAVNKSYEAEDLAYIDSTDLRNSDSAKEKRNLDIRLKEILDSKYKMGVVVDHIEKLSPFAMLLFHGYCDGDNAPYKKSVIVLVVHTDEDFSVLQNENMVDDLLFKNWKTGLEEDKIPPLIARVANNKVVIKGENSKVLEKYC